MHHSFENKRIKGKPMNLQELQKTQTVYDQHHYEINPIAVEKIRHILLHLAHTTGQLANYCETKEHSVNKETPLDFQFIFAVIPDLLIYSLQLANIFNINLEEAYLQRLQDNIKQLSQNKTIKKKNNAETHPHLNE